MSVTFIPEHLDQWDHPTGVDSDSNFIGDSDHLRDHYYLAPVSTSRDANILTRSNWEVVTDDILKYKRHVDTEICRFDHWACGWYEQLLIHKSDTKALKVAEEWCCALENYPVASDEHYSKLQWDEAAELYGAASLARPGFAMARSSEAMARYQLEQLEQAERDLRNLIRRYPMFADARAGLSALLWRQGQRGEAESHWAAASGLDPRYRQADWLLSVRRWPPGPTADLMAFLELKSP